MRQLAVFMFMVLMVVTGYTQSGVYDENGYPIGTNENILKGNNQTSPKPVYNDNGEITGYVNQKGNGYEVYDENLNYKGAVNDRSYGYQYEEYGVVDESENHSYEYYNRQNQRRSNQNYDSDRYSTSIDDRYKRAREYSKRVDRFYKFDIYDSYKDQDGVMRLFNHYGKELEVTYDLLPKGVDYVSYVDDEGDMFYLYVIEDLNKLLAD